METRTYNVYKFNELTDEQKEKAIDNLRDINVDYDWWEYINDDSAIELKEFDLYQQECRIDFSSSAEETARYIVDNHGNKCDTYKTSKSFLDALEAVEKEYNEYEKEADSWTKESRDMDSISLDLQACDDRMVELRDEYKEELARDILALLQSDYEHLTSDEAIIETIEANEYDFTTDGKIA